MTAPDPLSHTLMPGSRALTVVTDELAVSVLTPSLLLATVESTLLQMDKGRVLSGGKALIDLDDNDGRRTFLAMPGVLLEERVAGVKFVATVARNRDRGLPRAPAGILLSDAVTGLPFAVVEATSLTAHRTATMAAIAAKHGARRDASVAAIIGLGAIGTAAVPLLRALFPVQQFRVCAGNSERLRAKADMLASEQGVPFVACQNAREAAQGAQIVLVASGLSKDAPFLHADMLEAGAFVCAVGSYQEIAEDLIAAADPLVVDDWKACTARGNLAPGIRMGTVTHAAIAGELPALVAGRIPRPDLAKPMLVCLLGIGALDVALAMQILRATAPHARA